MAKSLNTIYGKKLMYLRTIFLIKQEDIVSRFKITQQAYGHMEMGKTNFSIKKLEKISEIFNITVQEFITLEVPTLELKTKDTDSITIKILKRHHEILLSAKDIQIAKLELENKRFKANIVILKDPLPLYVIF